MGKLLAVLMLAAMVAGATAAAAQEGIWEAIARQNPNLSPEDILAAQDLVLQLLSPEQARRFMAGEDPAGVFLVDGEDLASFLAEAIQLSAVVDPFPSQMNVESDISVRYNVKTNSTAINRFAGFLSRTPDSNVYAGLCRGCTTDPSERWVLFDNIAVANRFALDSLGRVGIGGQPTALATLDVKGPTGDSQLGGTGSNPLLAVRATDAAQPVFGTVLTVKKVSNAYSLELWEGDAFKPGGGSWAVVSDSRLKKNVSNLEGALERLLELRPVSFEYIDSARQPAGEQIGLIAQEVEDVFPNWVTDTADGYKAVAFKGFEALAVQALRELRDEKDRQLALKDQQLAELEARLARLEAMMQ